MIDTLRIELSESDDEDPGIRFLVNGTDLLDQVRETEEPFAIREGQPSNAGDYRGLPGATFAERRTEFMGESSGWPVDSSTVLYIHATCLNESCWPLLARISADRATVTWDRFQQPHRNGSNAAGAWDHGALGPFVFDRATYEAELNRAIDALTSRDIAER